MKTFAQFRKEYILLSPKTADIKQSSPDSLGITK